MQRYSIVLSIFIFSFFLGLTSVIKNQTRITEKKIEKVTLKILNVKKDLHESTKALAEVKAIAIRLEREKDEHGNRAADYERKAMMLLQKAQGGDLGEAEAERLAREALKSASS